MKKILDQFKSQVGENNLTFQVETSPFIRCIQTANEIAKAIDLGFQQIKINYRYMELMATYMYKYNPIP